MTRRQRASTAPAKPAHDATGTGGQSTGDLAISAGQQCFPNGAENFERGGGAKEMNKPFYYRLTAAEFLAEVFKIPKGGHEQWLSNLALDLVSGVGSTDYSKSMIDEAQGFTKRKSEAGKAGGLAKASSARERSSKS
jgi:hypothetical protein